MLERAVQTRPSLDPVDYAVISQGLIAAAREMGAKLVRSAYSTIIREAADASAALFDRYGNVVAQARLVNFGERYTVNAVTNDLDVGYLTKQEATVGKISARVQADGSGFDPATASANFAEEHRHRAADILILVNHYPFVFGSHGFDQFRFLFEQIKRQINQIGKIDRREIRFSFLVSAKQIQKLRRSRLFQAFRRVVLAPLLNRRLQDVRADAAFF